MLQQVAVAWVEQNRTEQKPGVAVAVAVPATLENFSFILLHFMFKRT